MTLPPGFRFHPTDEELVNYYLKKRVRNVPIEFHVIADVDLYKCEPWDLPSKSKLPVGDSEWFFFSPRDRKYPNGSRTNRATEAGYWKATGRDRTVRQATKTIGMKKTLVFYKGRAPHGSRTDWLMHEYRLDGEEWQAMNVPQDAYVLCRVFKKNGFDPTANTSGSAEECDQVDSPEGVNNITYDVKPNITGHLAIMPTLVPCDPVSCQEAVSLEDSRGNPSDYLTTTRNPFHSDAESESFLVDEGLIKAQSRNTENEAFEDIYSYCPPLEGGSLQLSDEDISSVLDLVDLTRAGRNDSHKPWQEPPGGFLNFKQDDYFSPMFHENDFGPLPTLVQLPSPPTASSCQENDTEGFAVTSETNFGHFRARKSSSATPLHALGTGAYSQYTAHRRVLLQRGITCASSQEEGDESHPDKSSEEKPPAVSQTKKVETGWTDLLTDCQTSTAAEDLATQKSTVKLDSRKEVSEKVPLEDTEPGFSSNTESSTEDVSQLTACQPVKPAEAGAENVAVTSSPSKKSSVDESSSMRIMGLRMLEPICGVSDFSGSGQTSSKGKISPGELPAGISSIHVNAVTVTCSCSSAHLPTKASACYCTFWEGRCEKEKPLKEEINAVQAPEGRNIPAARFSVGFLILGILLYLMSIMLFFRAISTDFEREYLSFRDLLFVVLGVVFCSLVQLVRRRRV